MHRFEKLDVALAQACASGDIPGVVAMVASRDGVLYQGAHGPRQLAGTQPMTADTLFWVASMTKAITTVAALQLVEQGFLTLDGPAGQWVPELAAPKVLEGFAADGTPLLRAANGKVTLRNLLTHTSGICYEIWNADLKAWLAHTGTPGMGSGKLAALQTPLVRDPGTAWEYSTGIDFVGRMIEAASGKRLDHYFAEHIFAPAGMPDTCFQFSPVQKLRLAAMHRRGADGALASIPFEVNQNPEFFGGGGGLYSTASDYIRFLQMILQGGMINGHRLLQPGTVAMMMQNQIGPLEVTKLCSVMPGASDDVDFWPGMPKKWSFGFMINTLPTPEGRSAGSLGWAGLSNCYYWLDPAQDRIGVLMMQVLPFNDAKCRAAYAALERAVYG